MTSQSPFMLPASARDPYDVDKIWSDTIEYMNEWYPYMTTYVLKMGKPRAMSDAPLAYVNWEKVYDRWDKQQERVFFNLNPDSLGPLNEEERVFVFVHETFHVLLNHNKLPFKDKKKANIAADIVINDYIVSAGLTKFEGLLYGENVIGFDSNGLTVKEVYDLLPPDPPAMSGGSALADILAGGDGSCGHDHDEQADPQNPLPDVLADAAPAEIKAAAEEKSIDGGKMAGDGHTDLQAWAEQQKVNLAWAEILEKFKPSIFMNKKGNRRRTTFNHLNRKVAWGAPKLILPVYRDTPLDGPEDGKVVRIVLAIDTSGSISSQTRDRFFRIAKSIPQDKIDLYCLSFTDVVTPFQIDNPHFRSGGTAFSPIESWIKLNVPEYPDGVIVFTDGQAAFYRDKPMPEHMKRWHWFLADRGTRVHDAYAQNNSGLIDQLERFVR